MVGRSEKNAHRLALKALSLIASRITGRLGSKRGSAASACSDHFFSASRDSLTRASIFFRQSTSRSLAAAAAAAW